MESTKLLPLGDQLFSGGNFDTAQSLTPPAGANIALMSPSGTIARWRDNGVGTPGDPTATKGIAIPDGSAYQYSGDLSRLRVIAVTAGGALTVSYYKIAG